MLIYSMMICCLLSLSFTAAVPHRLDKSPCFPCQSCGNHGPWMIYSPWPMQSPFWLSIMGAWQKELMLWTSLQCLASAEKNRSWSCSFPMVLILCVTCYPQLGNPKSKHELQRIQAKSQCLKPGPRYSSHCCRAGMSGTKPVPPNNLSLASPSWVSK